MNFLDSRSPWPHTVVEEVFSKNQYLTVVDLSRRLLPAWDYTDSDKLKRMTCFDVNGRRANGATNDHDVVVGPLLTSTIENVFARALRHIGVCPIPEHMMFQLDVMTPGYIYRMHNDVELKQASMIVYLGEVGRGTVLHDTKPPHRPVVEVPYRPNTAALFKRFDQSYHSINQEGITGLRYSLNMVHLLEPLEGGRALDAWFA